jgi:hypothetical protein
MKTLALETCPLFNDPCRHCSHEHSSRPYMKLDKDPRTGLFKPGSLGRLEVDLGYYCNDAGRYIDGMHYCPIKWDATKKEERALEYKKRVDKEEKKKKRKTSVKSIVKTPVKKRLIKVTKPKTHKKKVVTKGVKKRKL